MKLYDTHTRSWYSACLAVGLNPEDYSLKNLMEGLFLIKEQPTATFTHIRSMYSWLKVVTKLSNQALSPYDLSLLQKFLRGVFNVKPPMPKIKATWDVNIVLDYLLTLGANEQLEYLDLAGKCALLLLLSSMCRIGDLAQVEIPNIQRLPNCVELNLTKPTKTYSMSNFSKAKHLQKITICGGTVDKKLCPLSCLDSYIERTQMWRNRTKCKSLFLIIGNNIHQASNASIGRWVKRIINASGIKGFSSHSARSSGSSFLTILGMNVSDLISRVGWSNESTFVKTYLKPVLSKEKLLSLQTTSHKDNKSKAVKHTKPVTNTKSSAKIVDHIGKPSDKHNFKSIWSGLKPRFVKNTTKRIQHYRSKYAHKKRTFAKPSSDEDCNSSEAEHDHSSVDYNASLDTPPTAIVGTPQKSITATQQNHNITTPPIVKSQYNSTQHKTHVPVLQCLMPPKRGRPRSKGILAKKTDLPKIASFSNATDLCVQLTKIRQPKKHKTDSGTVVITDISDFKNKKKLPQNSKNAIANKSSPNTCEQLQNKSKNNSTYAVTPAHSLLSDDLSVIDLGIDEIKKFIQNSPAPNMFDDDRSDLSDNSPEIPLVNAHTKGLSAIDTPLFSQEGPSTVNLDTFRMLLSDNSNSGSNLGGWVNSPESDLVANLTQLYSDKNPSQTPATTTQWKQPIDRQEEGALHATSSAKKRKLQSDT